MNSVSEIKKIRQRLDLIADKLETLDDSNFDDSISEIKSCISEVEREKSSINLKPGQKISELNSSIKVLTKKILKKLDNIIQLKESNSKALSTELKKLNNQKKLALYKR